MRIGVDLGGTKIEALVLLDDGRVALRRRVSSPRDDYAATLLAVGALVDAVESEVGQKGRVGIGIPGTLSLVHGRVKNANSTWLIGRPLHEDLEQRLGRPVRLANDANCFALSEARDGAGAGARVVFGVIVGTGTGGGLVVDGQIITGANAIAGEWGHNPLPWPRDGEWPGPRCYCGRTGCIELFLSGPGLAREHRARTGRDEDASRDRRAGGGRATRTRRSPWTATRTAWPAPWPWSSTWWTPTSIVLGGGLSRIGPSTAACPSCGAPSCSRTAWTRACCRPPTAIPRGARRRLALGPGRVAST